MDNVIDIRDRQGAWFNVMALCLGCKHKWIGTVECRTSLFKLECPKCGAFDSFASFIPDQWIDSVAELNPDHFSKE